MGTNKNKKMQNSFKNIDIILASRSSRRQALLRQLDISFRMSPLDVDERYPAGLSPLKIAEYVSNLKAKAFPQEKIKNNTLVLTADTIVTVDNTILQKPKDEADAKKMLQMLSGRSHLVITGVSVRTKNAMKSFSSTTKVFFKHLEMSEIEYYIEEYQPFDKAGAYGIQEWIGKIGVEKIEGCFYNVMGLPMLQLYEELSNFASKPMEGGQ
jgi:septum formation protein